MSDNISLLIKELNKKVKIKGVTGFGKWGWVEKLTGKADGKHNQLCSEETKLTTPWIEHLYNCYESYRNGVYLKVVRTLEPMYREATALHTELHILNGTVLPEAGGSNAEEISRQKARRSAKLATNEEQINSIKVRLSQIGADIVTVDQAVTQNLGSAERILRSHVGSYWKGILRVRGGSEKLPSYPIRPTETGEGELSYNKHKEEILIFIQEGLESSVSRTDATGTEEAVSETAGPVAVA